jgi:hypothetical protein
MASHGFTDHEVVVKHTSLSKGAGNYFLIPRPAYSNGTNWDEDDALLIEYFDGLEFHVLTTPQWSVDPAETNLRIAPSVVVDWNQAFTACSLTLWWRKDPAQSYDGEGNLALSPQAIASQFDVNQRTSLVALEGLNRAIQISPLDEFYDEFTGKNIHPSSLTLPPTLNRAGKGLGFDGDGNITYFDTTALNAGSVNPADGIMARDSFGRSQVNAPAVALDIANLQTVQDHAALSGASAHGAKADTTVDSIMLRDSLGRSQVTTPSAGNDIANKSYVDGAGGVAASFILGSNIDNITTFGQTYKDAVQDTPVDGVSAPGLDSMVAATNTVLPLAGTKDWKITKPLGVNGLGQGWSVDFTIDRAYLGIPLQITMPYVNDAPNGFYKWFLYDITNANLIPISENNTYTSPNTSQFFAVFTPASTSLSYRLIAHVTDPTTAGPYSLRFDNLTVSKQATINGAAVGKVPSYVPTFGSGFNGTNTVQRMELARNLDKLHGMIQFSASSISGGGASISLPPGIAYDYTANTVIVGYWERDKATASTPKRGTLIASGTAGVLFFGFDDYTSAFTPFSGLNASQAFAAGDIISCTITGVQIAQWSVNINMATEAREYVSNSNTANAGEGSFVPANNVPGMGGSLIPGLTGGVGVVARFMAFSRPYQATDDIIVEVDQGSGAWVAVERRLGPFIDGTGTYKFGIQIIPVIGSTGFNINFGYGGCAPVNGLGAVGTAWSTLSTWKYRVRKVSNGNLAEQPPVVRAEYYSLVGSGTATPMQFNTKAEDTHSAVTTGASWKFTAPIPGVYSVTGVGYCTVGSDVALAKNGSLWRLISFAPSTGRFLFSTNIRLQQGDYINIYATISASTTDTASHIEITRIGS